MAGRSRQITAHSGRLKARCWYAGRDLGIRAELGGECLAGRGAAGSDAGSPRVARNLRSWCSHSQSCEQSWCQDEIGVHLEGCER